MDGALSYAWTSTRLFGKIALVRNTNDLVHQTKRSRSLGGGRQERNDPIHESCVGCYLSVPDRQTTISGACLAHNAANLYAPCTSLDPVVILRTCAKKASRLNILRFDIRDASSKTYSSPISC
jgi:hypothetical protein